MATKTRIPNPDRATLQEIPTELISDAAKSYPEVRLQIKRRNARGQWMGVGSGIMMPTLDLLKIDEWLAREAGGGDFRIQATDPNNAANIAVQPFMVPLEGPPKNYRGSAGEAPSNGYHAPSTGPTLHDSRADDPRRYFDKSSDQVANKGWDKADRERLDERRGRIQERERYETSMQQMRDRESRLLQEISDQKAATDRAGLQAQLDALKLHAAAPPAPAATIDWPGLIAAVAPIATAIVQSSGKRSQEMATLQAAAATQSNDVLRELVAASQTKDDPIEKMLTLVAAVQPFITQMMEQRDPTKMAEVLSTMGDQMLTQASLSAKMYQDLHQGDPEPPPWLPIVQAVADGVGEIASAYIDPEGKRAEQRVEIDQRNVPSADAEAPQVVDSAPAAAVEAPQVTPDVMKMRQVMAVIPRHFQSQEWATVVYHLVNDADSSEVARAAAVDMVELVRRSDAAELAAVAQEPSTMREAFFDRMPLSNGYKDTLVTAFVEEFQRVGGSPQPDVVNTQPAADERPRPTGMIEGVDNIPAHARLDRTPEPAMAG